ncbi:hypothetical protein [Moraxella sp. ZY210820]|uniref:hypothetical protein n=1 Tax=unclassified Moraxella TaxID=2685852 RepID=UPI002731B5F6|nr:hypothetical protein [Moraxella sp. ZY210820]WLF84504.1 hypothetical protein LU301_03240 [Moraxella sp. ZY210820]
MSKSHQAVEFLTPRQFKRYQLRKRIRHQIQHIYAILSSHTAQEFYCAVVFVMAMLALLYFPNVVVVE